MWQFTLKELRLYILFLVFPIFTVAQNFGNYGFGLNLISGYHFAANKQSAYTYIYDNNGNIISRIWNYGKSMDGIPAGINLSLCKIGSNQTTVNDNFGNPITTLNFSAIRLNNPDTFGWCFTLMPKLQIKILQFKTSNLSANIGYGLSYVTKKYDSLTNFDNRAIILPLNFAVDFGLVYNFKLGYNFLGNIGAKYFHVSNGSIKMPNGGFNMLLTEAGIAYTLTDYFKTAKPNSLKLNTNKYWFYKGHVAASYRQLGYFNNIKSFAVIINSNNLLYKINKLYSVGAGVDFFFDPSPALVFNPNATLKEIQNNKKFNAAVGISNSFNFSKIFVPVGIYQYIINLKTIKHQNYIRFGLGYYIKPKIYIGSFFKGTITKAGKLDSDFMEWSIGLTL